MKRHNYFLLLVILGLIFTAMTACSPDTDNPPAQPALEEVGSVPEELIHWLHSQLGLLKNPIIISEKYEDHTYILISMGEKSRDQGRLTLTEQKDSALSFKVTYEYDEGAGDSLDPHFMILKALPLQKLDIILKDGVSGSDLAGFSYRQD